MTSPPSDWLRDDDPSTLGRRIEHAVEVMDRSIGEVCPGCDGAVCGHTVLLSLAAGHEDAPLCLECLADEVARPPTQVRDGLVRYVLGKECLRRAWQLAGGREGVADDALPGCLWAGGEAGPAAARATAPTAAPSAPSMQTSATHAADTNPATEPNFDTEWNAGDLGCGELVLELRLRLKALDAGTVMRLVAQDPGAPEDLPAWCGLTGHTLVGATHPNYYIRRKD